MKSNLFILIVLLNLNCVLAQPFARWNNNSLTLDNGAITRIIQFDAEKDGAYTGLSLKLVGDNQEFLIPGSEEFAFWIDGKKHTGLDAWKLVSITKATDENNGNGALVTLENTNLKIQIGITYLLYPNLPLVRKKISFTNQSGAEINLEGLDIERLRFEASGTGTESWVMNDYARQKSLGQFVGNWYDPIVVVHETNKYRGIALGNEAPGVMKRTSAFIDHNLLTIGLTVPGQNYAFRQWIKPGETWESPWVFSAIYSKTSDPFKILNDPVNDFVRKHLGTRISKMTEKPVFVYNSWEPFWHNINEKMMYELIDAAADCGIEEFVIDDGWQDSYGDWGINKEKFPNGLKPIFDYIKSKGMKPGVWISIAAAESISKVYKEHPEWLVRKADGSPISLHADVDKMYEWESYSMCMTTGWRDYIKGVILKMVKDYGLEYIKADFAAVTGAYTTDKTRSGCHATNHIHKDRNESMLEMYQAT